MKLKENEIIQAYKDGESLNSIAKRFHTYATSIKRILNRNNVELRHDVKREGTLYVKDGEKLIEWAKAQGRLVTREELARIVGTKRLSPSYFVKYPELGEYVKLDNQIELQEYYNKLGKSVDALLLEDYSNIAICIAEKSRCISKNRYNERKELKIKRAKEAGVTIIFLNKEHFENLDELKKLLNDLKN